VTKLATKRSIFFSLEKCIGKPVVANSHEVGHWDTYTNVHHIKAPLDTIENFPEGDIIYSECDEGYFLETDMELSWFWYKCDSRLTWEASVNRNTKAPFEKLATKPKCLKRKSKKKTLTISHKFGK
jgi:hypothetical protein